MNKHLEELVMQQLASQVSSDQNSHSSSPCGCCGARYGSCKFPIGITMEVSEIPQLLEDYTSPLSERYSVSTHVIPLSEKSYLNLRLTHVVNPNATRLFATEDSQYLKEDTKVVITSKTGDTPVTMLYMGQLMCNLVQYGSLQLPSPNSFYPYRNIPFHSSDFPEARALYMEVLRQQKDKYLVFVLANYQLIEAKAIWQEVGWTNVVFESPKFNNRNHNKSVDYLTFFLIKT